MKIIQKGMVYFVGAGPGATDLITVRGMNLLQAADIVVYAGSLVNPDLLKETKEGCEIYNSAYMTLEEVIRVLKRGCLEQRVVVRLHTGDPSIYGAIKEQMDALDQVGISYEICPGVSSFCAAAAALEAEYTLPGVSQSVIITRMPGKTPVPEKERMRELASHGATMVIFLSTGLLKELQEELVQGYYTENTPCALVYKASWPEQKIIRTTVKNLAEVAKENKITKTALVVVGDCLEGDYELSKLYAASFSTEFRKAKNEVTRTDIE